jgi:TetR/AcrR family transcriptional repressor of nem operon
VPAVARPRAFDEDQAVDCALNLFWRRGYEATSVRDVLQHTGLGQGSLYAAFGDKHGLYLRALDRYADRATCQVVERLKAEGPVKPAIEALLRDMADDALCDPDRKGCLFVNAAAELVPHDPEVARRVEAAFARIEDALAGAVRRGQESGELAGGRDPRTLAQFLLTAVQGVRVVGKATPQPARLAGAIDTVMAVL